MPTYRSERSKHIWRLAAVCGNNPNVPKPQKQRNKNYFRKIERPNITAVDELQHDLSKAKKSRAKVTLPEIKF